MNRALSLATCAIAVLAAGCAGPRSGSDDATYYYANRETGKSVPTVQPRPVAAPTSNGPAGVARTVYFDYDQSSVRADDQATVAAHAAYLRQRPTQQVVLEGHTDPRGSREYNLALGQRRAEAVRRALVLQGANDANIEATSWGMEKPASTRRTEAGYQLDRRAEFNFR